jgi:hypothetical protein
MYIRNIWKKQLYVHLVIGNIYYLYTWVDTKDN